MTGPDSCRTEEVQNREIARWYKAWGRNGARSGGVILGFVGCIFSES